MGRPGWYRLFGHRLRVTRLALGISEAEAAAACLITLRTYRRREAGLPYHGWHYGLSSFVHKYDVSWHWMLAGHGEMRASAEEARKADLSPPTMRWTQINPGRQQDPRLSS